LLLLSRVTKRRARILFGVAVGLLVMRLVDLHFIVTPALHPGHVTVHWMDFLALIGIGGVWVWAFLGQLRGKSLLPLHDPRFAAGSEPAHGV
jgi:hypothetical protein